MHAEVKAFPFGCFPGPEDCMAYDPNPQGLVAFYNYFLDLLSGTVRNCSIAMTRKDMRQTGRAYSKTDMSVFLPWTL